MDSRCSAGHGFQLYRGGGASFLTKRRVDGVGTATGPGDPQSKQQNLSHTGSAVAITKLGLKVVPKFGPPPYGNQRMPRPESEIVSKRTRYAFASLRQPPVRLFVDVLDHVKARGIKKEKRSERAGTPSLARLPPLWGREDLQLRECESRQIRVKDAFGVRRLMERNAEAKDVLVSVDIRRTCTAEAVFYEDYAQGPEVVKQTLRFSVALLGALVSFLWFGWSLVKSESELVDTLLTELAPLKLTGFLFLLVISEAFLTSMLLSGAEYRMVSVAHGDGLNESVRKRFSAKGKTSWKIAISSAEASSAKPGGCAAPLLNTPTWQASIAAVDLETASVGKSSVMGIPA
ncbi:hypothetical protein B0H19DRAFT_1083861 [Mycena capillaripes]|nr:hypothetical protein B0H19DRAFT_1083861 [Mycena capillaripes]